MISRLNALIGISACTGFMCVQQFTKKGIVLHHFANLLKEDNAVPIQNNQTGKKSSLSLRIKEKYQKSIQKIKQITEKVKGNQSAVKKLAQEKPKEQKQSESPPKTYWQIMIQTFSQSKEVANQMKQIGSGSYFQGFKNLYRQYMYPETTSKTTAPNQQNSQNSTEPAKKQNVVGRFTRMYELYKKASDAKNQKLVQNHIIFGSLALAGSLIMPKMYMLLCVGYFTAYQAYYFGEVLSRNKGYKSLQNINFVPIWQGFMIGSVTLFGTFLVKVYLALH